MKPASYSVLRYIPDLGRNEQLNIGIVLWDATYYRLAIDAEAIARVIRDAPNLPKDALLYLEHSLREKIGESGCIENQSIRHLIENQQGFPWLLTEPRYTTLESEREEAFEHTLERLMQRIVRPLRRPGGSAMRMVDVLGRRFQPLIAQRVIQRNYLFASSRSGTPRSAEFFVNTSVNHALDTLSLAIKDARDIRLRADAEAFKIEDVRSRNDVGYLVCCSLNPDLAFDQINTQALYTLQSVGAIVTTDVDQADKIFNHIITERNASREPILPFS